MRKPFCTLALLACVAAANSQFCGRAACSSSNTPNPQNPGDFLSNCTEHNNCCRGTIYKAQNSTTITAVDLSALKGITIPGTDENGNQYNFEMCAAAPTSIGCMRGVLNGSSQYSTMLWRQNQRDEVHGCKELATYDLTDCSNMAASSIGINPRPHGPIFPDVKPSCANQYRGLYYGPVYISGTSTYDSWDVTAGLSINNWDDGPLVLTMKNGVNVTFECNPESVVPLEPFNVISTDSATTFPPYKCTGGTGGVCDKWTPPSSATSFSIYTSLVCANGGTELRPYQKRAERERMGY
jgi:hypothetical protein